MVHLFAHRQIATVLDGPPVPQKIVETLGSSIMRINCAQIYPSDESNAVIFRMHFYKVIALALSKPASHWVTNLFGSIQTVVLCCRGPQGHQLSKTYFIKNLKQYQNTFLF